MRRRWAPPLFYERGGSSRMACSATLAVVAISWYLEYLPLPEEVVHTKLGSVALKFTELIRLLENNGYTLVRQKGSVRYYGRTGWPRLIRVDYHGPKEVPNGTCHSILKAAGIPKPGRRQAEPPPDEASPEEQP